MLVTDLLLKSGLNASPLVLSPPIFHNGHPRLRLGHSGNEKLWTRVQQLECYTLSEISEAKKNLASDGQTPHWHMLLLPNCSSRKTNSAPSITPQVSKPSMAQLLNKERDASKPLYSKKG